MKDMNQLEEFEKYFSGLMQEEEKLSFEKRIRVDKDLNKDFRFYKELYDALKNEEAINLRKKLEKAERKYGQKSIHRKFLTGRNNLLLAATLIILAGIVFLIILYRGNNILPQSEDYIAWVPGPDVSKEFILPKTYYFFREMQVTDGALEVITPPDSSLILPGSQIQFRWKNNIENNMVFILSNWQDSIVHLEGIKGQGFTINSSLNRGIYYYRIMNNDNLKKLGVFIIDESDTRNND
jgi:hypothetical protein